MMQYKYNDSVLTEIPNPKGAFVSLTNQDGKKWTLPVCHCSTGLEIYEPSGIKGHLLKLGFPLLCKTGCHKLGRCSPCNVYLGKPLKELLDSLFKTYEYSIFWGTPSTDQKITIQIFRKKELLGYCKISDAERVNSLFQHEKGILDMLNQCGVAHVPQCLGVFPLTETAAAFVQTTEKKFGAKIEHHFGEKQQRFLQELYEKTREPVSFEATDFYDSMLYLKSHVGLLNTTYQQCVTEATEELLSKYRQRTVLWGVCHRDFTPWNTCTVGNDLFVFDFEYALRHAPKEMDFWHFYIQTAFYERKMPIEEIVAEIRQKYAGQTEQLSMYLLDNMSMYLRRGAGANIDTANWRANLLVNIRSN